LIVEKNSEGVALFDFGTRNTGFEQAKYFRGAINNRKVATPLSLA